MLEQAAPAPRRPPPPSASVHQVEGGYGGELASGGRLRGLCGPRPQRRKELRLLEQVSVPQSPPRHLLLERADPHLAQLLLARACILAAPLAAAAAQGVAQVDDVVDPDAHLVQPLLLRARPERHRRRVRREGLPAARPAGRAAPRRGGGGRHARRGGGGRVRLRRLLVAVALVGVPGGHPVRSSVGVGGDEDAGADARGAGAAEKEPDDGQEGGEDECGRERDALGQPEREEEEAEEADQ
mmetsp:Transcript_33994/g.109155  ORF Transcript_33994/g.109155 Transcript_33994/m.109155 type:complete len:241 (-) Transcript_33994:433-1155(-)